MDTSKDPENAIQSACADALAVYFDRKEVTYRQLWTYSNQQGTEANKFCGDMVGVIDDSVLLLMEFKALDHATNILSSFVQTQYDEAVVMENIGIPIVYCYDSTKPLPYYFSPRQKNWPIATLKSINASIPSLLPSATPNKAAHSTLLDWINKRSGKDPLEKIGAAIGRLLPNSMRTGILTVVYSKAANQAFGLNSESLAIFYNWLINHPRSEDDVIQRRIAKLKAAIEDEGKKVLTKKAISPF